MTKQNVITVPINTKGTDYVCGDIHGCFTLFDQKLQQLNFDKQVDRVFVVGDLIDRGLESERVTEYIGQPWFYSVVGNHEMMLLASQLLTDPKKCEYYRSIWYNNGGYWWTGISSYEQQEIVDAIDTLPLVIEVETTHGKVGIVHSDFTGSWDELTNHLTAKASDIHSWCGLDPIIQSILWSRRKANIAINNILPIDPVEGIAHVFHGHTIVDHPITAGNTTFIDTGSYRHASMNVHHKHATITIQPILDYLI